MLAALVSPQNYTADQDFSWSSRREKDAAWRANAWQDNLSALAESNLIGVGFGVPYHILTARNLLDFERHSATENLPPSTPKSEYAYVNGQHSSIINVFFRLGVIGGVVFLALNIVLFGRLVEAASTVNPVLARLNSAAAALFVITFIQIAVNVGLESPPNFLVYIFATSFALYCLEVSKGCERAGTLANSTMRLPMAPAVPQC
jgi:O-antigen ligase